MPRVEVVMLPEMLREGELRGKVVVVFDVLRATTTMTAGLAMGLREIRVYRSVDAAREAAQRCSHERKFVGTHGLASVATTPLLCGEEKCLSPEGFDLGNSPGQFTAQHAGRVAIMSTTNGTKAILAAREAERCFVGALVNAAAVAEKVEQNGKDVVLICAGTNGRIAMEDLLGAGAVIAHLRSPEFPDDTGKIAVKLFESQKSVLMLALRESSGGINVINAKLSGDIDFAAQLNRFQIVGEAALSGGDVVVKIAR